MQPSKKFAFDVGVTFLASVVTLPLGFVITILLGRYLGAGNLGLYRMTTTIYGIAMLVAAFGIPAAMIKNNKFKFIEGEYLYVSRNGKSGSYKS